MIYTRSSSTPVVLFTILIALICHSSSAQEGLWSEGGTRGGIMETSAGEFRQFEVYVVHPMKLRFDLFDDWVARTQWEMSGGQLSHKGIDALIFTAGTVVELRKGDEDWFLEAGSRPTLITEYDFGEKEFGGPFQFTSHGGIGWGNGLLEIAYRFQHMSNARIYSDNDGLNLHVLEIGWKF